MDFQKRKQSKKTVFIHFQKGSKVTSKDFGHLPKGSKVRSNKKWLLLLSSTFSSFFLLLFYYSSAPPLLTSIGLDDGAKPPVVPLALVIPISPASINTTATIVEFDFFR
jgi:hypothetical protein